MEMLYKLFYLNILSNLKWKMTVFAWKKVMQTMIFAAQCLIWKISFKAALRVLSDIHWYVPFVLLFPAFDPGLIDGALHLIIPFCIHLL